MDIKNPDIPELHAIISILKPLCSWSAKHIIGVCREILGGHGYSKYNRLGELYYENGI